MKNLNLKSIGEHSYTWEEGFSLADNMEKYEGGMRQVDWGTVKQIVEMKEFDSIEVGLAEDYYQTHAIIFENGEKVFKGNDGAGFYGASNWATPAIKLYKNGESFLYECWVMGTDTSGSEWMSEL